MQLRALFQRFGNVEDVSIVRGPDGVSKREWILLLLLLFILAF